MKTGPRRFRTRVAFITGPLDGSTDVMHIRAHPWTPAWWVARRADRWWQIPSDHRRVSIKRLPMNGYDAQREWIITFEGRFRDEAVQGPGTQGP